MTSALVTTKSSPPHSVPKEITAASTVVAASDFVSPRMMDIMRVVPMEELRIKMRKPAVTNAAELRTADTETKIQALSEFTGAYLPMAEVLTFVSQVLAKIREVYRAKQFDDEEFRRYFHETAEVMHGNRLRPLPACLKVITGNGFWLTGPSLMGRTATLQRIVELLGAPFMLNGAHPAPRCMWVIPVLYLSYPTCGTMQGLLRDMRERLLSVVGSYDTNVNALADMEGPNGQNIAIAICTLLNVGLVILDGGCFSSISQNSMAILEFFIKLREASSIPVIISGTSAFMHSVSFMGSKGSNLINGSGLHFDPFPRPTRLDGEETLRNPGIWRQMVTWLWKQGVLPENCEMPKELPEWTYDIANGRLGWLVQGFRDLHIVLVMHVELQNKGKLSEEIVKRVFSRTLQLSKDASNTIAGMPSKQSTKKTQILKHLDHFPSSIFESPSLYEWLDSIFHIRMQKI